MSAESDLELVRGLVGAALSSLETSRGRIDDLNVYPVPDGDTGTNLTLTVRAVADAVASAGPGDYPELAPAGPREHLAQAWSSSRGHHDGRVVAGADVGEDGAAGGALGDRA